MTKFLVLTFFSLLSFEIQAQIYECIDGNEESICDQKVRFHQDHNNNIRAITVEYVGWCGSMGPYTYYCQNNICEDAGIKFEFASLTNYHWTNKQYGFQCHFSKK